MIEPVLTSNVLRLNHEWPRFHAGNSSESTSCYSNVAFKGLNFLVQSMPWLTFTPMDTDTVCFLSCSPKHFVLSVLSRGFPLSTVSVFYVSLDSSLPPLRHLPPLLPPPTPSPHSPSPPSQRVAPEVARNSSLPRVSCRCNS